MFTISAVCSGKVGVSMLLVFPQGVLYKFEACHQSMRDYEARGRGRALVEPCVDAASSTNTLLSGLPRKSSSSSKVLFAVE